MKMRETSRGRDKELFVNNNVFLNPDRVSLPDIDTDFSKHARAVTIKHVTELYGQSVKIQTKITLGGKSAMDYASKLYALETDQVKGFYSELVKELKSAYDLAYENAKDQKHFTLATWKPDFVTQFGNNMNAIKILDEAILIEGMMTSTGVHAAGQVMANDRIENYIPLAKDVDDDGEEVWIIQADMTECEGNLGFIKMDFLGLKNLTLFAIARECSENEVDDVHVGIGIPVKDYEDVISRNKYRAFILPEGEITVRYKEFSEAPIKTKTFRIVSRDVFPETLGAFTDLCDLYKDYCTNVPVKEQIKLLNYLQQIPSSSDRVIYESKINRYVQTEMPEFKYRIGLNDAIDAVYASIMAQLGKAPAMGKVYIDPELVDVALPGNNERTASKGSVLPAGSILEDHADCNIIV